MLQQLAQRVSAAGEWGIEVEAPFADQRQGGGGGNRRLGDAPPRHVRPVAFGVDDRTASTTTRASMSAGAIAEVAGGAMPVGHRLQRRILRDADVGLQRASAYGSGSPAVG